MPDLPTPLANDPELSFELNVVGQSPHIFAYRFWFNLPQSDDWTEFAEGATDDDIPDHFSIGSHPDGSRLAMAMAIGGNPSTTYRVAVVFSQSGEIVHGGMNILQGRTSDSGGAAQAKAWVLV